MQNQRESKHGGEETAGKPPQEVHENMEDLTDRVVLAVLDYLDGNSAVSSHSMTRELLISTAAKLRQIAANTYAENSAEKKAQLLPSPSSQVDDLTITCTHDVIDGIIQVYKSNGGGETAELTNQGIQEVMQELGNITSSGRSSTLNDVEVIDLEENTETSVSVMGEAASSHSGQDYESLLSDEFQQKVKSAVSDVLLKTSGAMSVHSSKTFGDVTLEDLEVFAEQPGTSKSSVLVEAAASDIAETVLEDLKKVSSHNGTEPAPSRETFSSAARRLYKNVHHKIFRFLLRLQESSSEKEEKIRNEDQSSVSLSLPHLTPRIQLQVGSCMDEVFVKVVETYKSEPLLSSCSCRRASSSATPPAVDRNLETRNTAWASMNSSREICSRLRDVSITTEEPDTSRPFFGLRRVKDFLTHLFRPSTSHTPITTINGEDMAEGQEVLPESQSRTEDLLSQVGSDQTLTDRTRDILTRESPVLASIASYRTDNMNSDSPDPATEKKRGLRFSKRLTRTFSAIRRALPNPFKCMTGPP